MINTPSKSNAYFLLFILVIFYVLVDVSHMLVNFTYIPNILQFKLASH